MTRRYVVHTQVGAEGKAFWHLSNQGFECFLPRMMKLKRHASRVHTTLGPLFPRYLFIRLDLDTMRCDAINGTRGVVALVTDGSRPLAVPVGVVESLRAISDPEDTAPLAAIGIFTKGSNVRIKSGSFAGQKGFITENLSEGRDRVCVLLTLLGAEAELQVPSYAVEAA